MCVCWWGGWGGGEGRGKGVAERGGEGGGLCNIFFCFASVNAKRCRGWADMLNNEGLVVRFKYTLRSGGLGT